LLRGPFVGHPSEGSVEHAREGGILGGRRPPREARDRRVHDRQSLAVHHVRVHPAYCHADPVGQRHTCARDAQAREGVRPRQRRASRQAALAAHRHRQATHNESHRLDGQQVRVGGRGGVQGAFEGVRERVEARRGRQVRRRRHHQFGIDDGHAGKKRRVVECALVALGAVGDDGHLGDLRPGSRGRGDGDNGQNRQGVGLLGLVVQVVPGGSGMARFDRDRLGGVHTGSSAQPHDDFGAELVCHGCALGDQVRRGIGQHAIEVRHLDAGRPQGLAGRFVRRFDRRPRLGRDEEATPAEARRLLANLPQPPGAEHDLGGVMVVERLCHRRFSQPRRVARQAAPRMSEPPPRGCTRGWQRDWLRR